MITRTLRDAARREEGQALVLACLTIFVISLAVITTATLGRSIDERVHLQDTADAAAYSTAAMEARAFNFYAFVNRTHASHYVSAMLWQSLLSFTYFTEAFLVDLYGVMKTLDPCAGETDGVMGFVCDVLKALPYVGPIIRFIGQVIGLFRGALANVLLPMLRQLDPDRVIGRSIIPSYREMNGVLTRVAKATLVATLSQARSSSYDVVLENDPSLNGTPPRVDAGELSACMLSRAHMDEAWASDPLDPKAHQDSSRVARAKRAMGGISNATRFALDRHNNGRSLAGAGWVTDRSLDGLIQLPSYLRPLTRLVGGKLGQTRLLSYSPDRPAGRNPIRDWEDPPDAPDGMLGQGDELGSDDLYALNLGPARIGAIRNPLSCGPNDPPDECWGDPRKGLDDDTRSKLPFRYTTKTSIWARSSGGGLHYRLVSMPGGRLWPNGQGAAAPLGGTNNPERELGLNRVSKAVLPELAMDVWTANVLGVEDGNHPWPGLAPFPHFEPGQFGRACRGASATTAAGRDEEFNQPSSFVVLQKRSPAFVGPKRLQNTRQATAVSRAQTYYHRPGNWHEQPNFFNPYWRPRLASVLQGRYAGPLVDELLDEVPEEIAVQKALVH
jgi:hypothetical protein